MTHEVCRGVESLNLILEEDVFSTSYHQRKMLFLELRDAFQYEIVTMQLQ